MWTRTTAWGAGAASAALARARQCTRRATSSMALKSMARRLSSLLRRTDRDRPRQIGRDRDHAVVAAGHDRDRAAAAVARDHEAARARARSLALWNLVRVCPN